MSIPITTRTLGLTGEVWVPAVPARWVRRPLMNRAPPSTLHPRTGLGDRTTEQNEKKMKKDVHLCIIVHLQVGMGQTLEPWSPALANGPRFVGSILRYVSERCHDAMTHNEVGLLILQRLQHPLQLDAPCHACSHGA